MRSLRTKLIFWICTLFFIIGALIYIPLSKILPQKITDQILKRDLESAQNLSLEAKRLLLLNDEIELSLFLYDSLNRLEDAQYLFIQGPHGEIIAHTFQEGFPKGLLNFNIIQNEHKIKYFLNDGRKMFDISVPILDGAIGALHLGVSLESGEKDVAAITRINDYVGIVILLGLGIGILVFLIIGFLFSNKIIRLKDFAAKIGSGDLDVQNDIISKDEIGDLSMALNEMAQNLKEKIQEIKSLHIIEERNRIALDLHDGCAQDMANIIQRIELSKKLFAIDPQKAFEELNVLNESAKNVLDRTRKVIFDLKSLEDTGFDLLERVNAFVYNYQKQEDVYIACDVSGMTIKIFPEKAKIIFRIIIEAFNNIRKHSLARSVKLKIKSINDDHLIISIRDDGEGFDVDHTLSRSVRDGKLGLISMQQRTKSLNGSIAINSAPQQGTHIFINIPLREMMMEACYEI